MDTDDLKSRLQRHFADGLVAVVGSGLSCAEGLPGMGELARHLSATVSVGLSAGDLIAWEDLLPEIESRGLEAALLATAPNATLEAAIVDNSAKLIAAKEREVVAEVFSGRRTLRLTRLIPHLLKPATGLPIITTNYDRLVEIAVEEAGLGVDTLFIGNFAGTLNEKESQLSFCREVILQRGNVRYRYRDRALVLKPHGSLDWYHRAGNPVRYSGHLDLPRLIITPGINKFRNGYESPFDRHRERANHAIDRAARFLILGYGFNDDHLETHLTPRIRSGVPTLLLTYALSENARALATACQNLIAIEHANEAGDDGSRVFVNRAEYFFPGVNYWDLESFISEVLEP